ncbi:MAG: response regulator [Gammaproteobacteria bacterium]|jgi:DNA-binding response OmpR family regulator|nr:response regulator [Gammaproteobacteria bacterium]MBT3860837.1 response regulator [Gammaproteobacteria bacterium]MBT3986908.1 response regulator [Gammaproteobacteria bacterium]MBT4254951.1 response regulator [Gammaproteobacteria bacterium]MBT4582111.1 response regulator [Gammaproteobacteria bacterium]
MQILLVEDDRPLAASLQKALVKSGYAINHVETGKAALHTLQVEKPDILVLDIGLPDTDGISILKALRKTDKELPVLLLTARDSVEDKVQGLDSGADDYLAKPFEVTELLARLRVLERRLGTVKTSAIKIGGVNLDTVDHVVTLEGKDLELSRKEYMLLKSLMENAGRVQTRSTLENRLYSWGEEVASNALEVHIHHLRKKLGNEFIKTIRGVGYKVSAQ